MISTAFGFVFLMSAKSVTRAPQCDLHAPSRSLTKGREVRERERSPVWLIITHLSHPFLSILKTPRESVSWHLLPVTLSPYTWHRSLSCWRVRLSLWKKFENNQKKSSQVTEHRRLTFSGIPPHAPHQPPSLERGAPVHADQHPWGLPAHFSLGKGSQRTMLTSRVHSVLAGEVGQDEGKENEGKQVEVRGAAAAMVCRCVQ